MMKRLLLILAAGALAIYFVAVGILYFIQERFIFFPQKLNEDYRFAFEQQAEELFFKTEDGMRLHGLLFRADAPRKGLIFYLHGNAGSMASWGSIAGAYTVHGYDLFMLDYRGFGKSEGSIRSEAQLHRDVQAVYDSLKKGYEERDIVVLGYSIGTGPAARLAAANNPGRLILQAPYYSLSDLMRSLYPYLPGFLLRYKLETNRYLPACRMPVTIFHGDRDAVISPKASLKLKELFKPGDTLIILEDQPHNGMSDHPQYRAALKTLLAATP